MSNLPDERARFEAWADSQPGGIGRVWRSTEPGYEDTYGDSHTQIAWRTWQEAVRQERERLAAQWDGCICEGNGEDIGQMMREDAAAIRARST